MPTYFGKTSIGASSDFGDQGLTLGNKTPVTFTCPGSGNQVVKEISIHACSNNGTNSTGFRCAIYSSNLSTKICEGTAEVVITDTSFNWVGHMSQAEIAPNPAILVGGTNYALVFTINVGGTQLKTHYDAVTSGEYAFQVNDYTSGFPSSLTLGSNTTLGFNIRVGVDPAEPSTGFGTIVQQATYGFGS